MYLQKEKINEYKNKLKNIFICSHFLSNKTDTALRNANDICIFSRNGTPTMSAFLWD